MSMEQLLNQEEQKAADEFATKNVVTAIEGGKFDSINLQTGLSSEGKVFEELRVENGEWSLFTLHSSFSTLNY